MKITLYNYARSFLVTFHTDGDAYDAPNYFSNINEALAYVEQEIDKEAKALTAHIMDAETGELYVTCSWDDDSIPEEDYYDYDWGYNEDMGFDPYLGCYTDDC